MIFIGFNIQSERIMSIANWNKSFLDSSTDHAETVPSYEALQMSKVNSRHENVKTINRFKVENKNTGMTSSKTSIFSSELKQKSDELMWQVITEIM